MIIGRFSASATGQSTIERLCIDAEDADDVIIAVDDFEDEKLGNINPFVMVKPSLSLFVTKYSLYLPGLSGIIVIDCCCDDKSFLSLYVGIDLPNSVEIVVDTGLR
ncbi:hypothetical protein DERP_009464 [Dermatophagoides pteronyssinus]|uniref:Uncharacterized protein n=1 Tax=Dermatophagoides pteronyssinus TaxID=6956 RepID=A0ABQ8IUY8_DERPT|nr:hypothetical protein DERP_009464 [Dermatophagoides pteronyssinus]